MKILLLTDGVSPFVIGGMQKHSYYLAKFLAMQGHQVTLIHCVYGQNAMPDKEAITAAFGEDVMRNLEIISMRFPPASWYPGHYLKESYMYSRQIYDRLKDRLGDFDFIYAKGFVAWYFLEKKGKGEKMPPVGVKFHGYEMFQEPANLKMRMHNWLLRSPVLWNNQHADRIFSYGGKITKIIRDLGVSDEKIIEIPTGIESTWIREQDVKTLASKRTFVFVGRFERRKGIEELTTALRALPKNEAFEFHFIGPIPPSNRIKSENIHYHGSLKEKSDIIAILDKCDVLVVPSHSEGMPNVIMEGMARGLAVLTTDVGAIASVVDASNGWFVKPGDAESLKSTIASIIAASEVEIQSRRNASLRKIRSFTWDEIARRNAEAMAKHCR